MKPLFAVSLLLVLFSAHSPAQACREVVRDASGRITGSSTATGKCPGPAKVPVPPMPPKK